MWIVLEDLGKENVLRISQNDDHQGGRGSEERESSWRDSLHGENNQGEMIFKERISLWTDSSRREKLRGEPSQL
jgi:hypothetical protein